MPTLLITGGAGYLGSRLVRHAPDGVELHATRRASPVGGCTAHPVELSNPLAVRQLWARLRPDVVIHTAYSMDAGERDIWLATRAVVDACAEQNAALIHLSTDLVLDGERAPYDETAEPAPVNDYGRWKARAEEYVRAALPDAAVVRTSLITGLDPVDPRTEWVLSGLRGDARVSLFADEIRCPIAVDDLARQLWEIVALPAERRAGVWNLAGPEALSRYSIGLMIAARFGLPAERLAPALSRSAPSPRPRDLRLTTARADAALVTRARSFAALLAGPLLAEQGTPD